MLPRRPLPPMLERGYGDFISFSSMTGIIPWSPHGRLRLEQGCGAALQRNSLSREPRQWSALLLRLSAGGCDTPLWRQAEAHRGAEVAGSRGETLTPDEVIAEVERCLESGKVFAYPGKQTKFGVMMRRLFPGSRLEGVA
jgi:hypothetical protein